jgi:dolichyl-phosphate-mannose--protein O-mannosyl transferase
MLAGRPRVWHAVGLGAASALVRLYGLSHPNGVVFDEYHFGTFTNAYNEGVV